MVAQCRFQFKPVDAAHVPLVHRWLTEPPATEWFYGQGLQNTFRGLEEFLRGSASAQYWLAYDKGRPFAFLITSSVSKPHDELSRFCTEDGDSITLDMLIGDPEYLGIGLSQILIEEFLTSQFPKATEVLIDPEATNARAIHVYKKAGFVIIEEFIPRHSPHPHYMMRLNRNRPHALKEGDHVAIISPSSGMPHLFPWVYEQGLSRIREVFHLRPVEYPTATQSSEYLSQNPKARAEDINRAFADPSIKAIIATIGGIDQIRILPYLDKEVISANPKIFMGYSDCTNLHLFLWNLGIVSYYGGAVMTQFAMGGGMQEYTVNSIKKALFTPPIGEVHAAPEWSDVDLDWADPQNLNKKRPMYKGDGWHWHNSSKKPIRGKLWGGCLEVLDLHLSVKRYLPTLDQLDGTVLFIETSEETPSEGLVYSFISALAELGMLQKFKAILVGYPKAQFCGKQPPEGREAYILNQQTALKSALRDYNCNFPVIFNMNFGHTDPQIIIPSGGTVTIDGTKKTIHFT